MLGIDEGATEWAPGTGWGRPGAVGYGAVGQDNPGAARVDGGEAGDLQVGDVEIVVFGLDRQHGAGFREEMYGFLEAGESARALLDFVSEYRFDDSGQVGQGVSPANEGIGLGRGVDKIDRAFQEYDLESGPTEPASPNEGGIPHDQVVFYNQGVRPMETNEMERLFCILSFSSDAKVAQSTQDSQSVQKVRVAAGDHKVQGWHSVPFFTLRTNTCRHRIWIASSRAGSQVQTVLSRRQERL